MTKFKNAKELEKYFQSCTQRACTPSDHDKNICKTSKRGRCTTVKRVEDTMCLLSARDHHVLWNHGKPNTMSLRFSSKKHHTRRLIWAFAKAISIRKIKQEIF